MGVRVRVRVRAHLVLVVGGGELALEREEAEHLLEGVDLRGLERRACVQLGDA